MKTIEAAWEKFTSLVAAHPVIASAVILALIAAVIIF